MSQSHEHSQSQELSPSSEQLRVWLPAVIDIAVAAGHDILRIYEADFDVTLKRDRSPLTEADLAAQRTIGAGLAALTPQISMLGEESAPGVFEQRRGWQTLWLVDPLDGTREFVKRNGEFTVNIALVHRGEAVLGVVYAPVTGVAYAAARHRRGTDPAAGARQPLARGCRARSHARAAGHDAAHQRRQCTEVRAARRGRGGPVRTARQYLRMGHGGRPRGGTGGRRSRGGLHRSRAALQRARHADQSVLHRLRRRQPELGRPTPRSRRPRRPGWPRRLGWPCRHDRRWRGGRTSPEPLMNEAAAGPLGRIDLHTHSCCSDGTLR